MARARKTDLLGRLADLSEEAIQRFTDAPGADRLLGALNATRERLDELQKRVRGLEELERRIVALERKVDRLSKGGAPAAGTARRTTRAAGAKTTAAKRPAAKKTS